MQKKVEELAQHTPEMMHKNERKKQVASVKGALKHHFTQKMLHEHFMEVVQAYLDSHPDGIDWSTAQTQLTPLKNEYEQMMGGTLKSLKTRLLTAQKAEHPALKKSAEADEIAKTKLINDEVQRLTRASLEKAFWNKFENFLKDFNMDELKFSKDQDKQIKTLKIEDKAEKETNKVLQEYSVDQEHHFVIKNTNDAFGNLGLAEMQQMLQGVSIGTPYGGVNATSRRHETLWEDRPVRSGL